MSMESEGYDPPLLDFAFRRQLETEHQSDTESDPITLRLAETALMHVNTDKQNWTELSKQTVLKIKVDNDILSTARQSDEADDGKSTEGATQKSLYDRIIDLELIPPHTNPNGNLPPIEAIITNNSTLKIGDSVIRLNHQERFIFNGLLLYSGQPRTAVELYNLGIYNATKATSDRVVFHRYKKSLADKLFQATNRELVITSNVDHESRYSLYPNLRLVEQRSNEERAKVIDIFDRTVKMKHQPILEEAETKRSGYWGPSIDQNAAIPEFEDDVKLRLALITGLVKKYKSNLQFIRAIDKLGNNVPVLSETVSGLERYLQISHRYGLLSKSGTTRLFKVIERGIDQYKPYQADSEQPIDP